MLALGVAAGPLVGYAISRSVGLPDATDDIGNWTEPIGVAALVVEALLLLIALGVLTSALRRRRTTAGSAQRS